MVFFASPQFVSDFNKLIRKTNKYGCVGKSLYKILYKQPENTLLLSGSLLSKFHKKASLVKKRADTCGNNGKSGGFRLITFVNLESKECGLIMVYPKWGSMAIECPRKEEWQKRLKMYSMCKEKGELIKVTFNTEKKTIEFEDKIS